MRTMFIAILLFLGIFTGTALAAGTVAAEPGLLELSKSVFDAVMRGQWIAAAAFGVVLLCAAARRYMPESWREGTKGDIIGTACAFLMAFAGAIGAWAIAPGAVMTWEVALTALKVGVAAIGGYTIIHKVAGWLAGWSKLPAWALALLKLLTMIVGSMAVKKAEAAGAAAVAANPPTGMAGADKITEVE